MSISGLSNNIYNTGDLASAFAASIAGRIGKSNGLTSAFGANQTATSGAPETIEQNPDQQTSQDKLNQLRSLESSLADTVSYMAEKHGDKAATAMMGIISKSLGNSEITEENLGNALIDVVRFIDKNFGINEGDAFMDNLNGNLNKAMNEFFDNGTNETFFDAATAKSSSATSAEPSKAATPADMMADIASEYTNAIKEMLAKLREKQEDAVPYGQQAETNLSGILADTVV